MSGQSTFTAKSRYTAFSVFLLTILWFSNAKETAAVEQATDGAAVVSFFGYDDCIKLENETTRVILCPAAGGRVARVFPEW